MKYLFVVMLGLCFSLSGRAQMQLVSNADSFRVHFKTKTSDADISQMVDSIKIVTGMQLVFEKITRKRNGVIKKVQGKLFRADGSQNSSFESSVFFKSFNLLLKKHKDAYMMMSVEL
jgi:hypothetical protein